MKTNHPFHSLRSHWAMALLVATATIAPAFDIQAAKPQPPPPQNGSLEVLVTGDLASAPDHTGADDDSYDVCRDASFSGGGADQLGLRKVRLDLTVISQAVPTCVVPGVTPRGSAVIRFPDNTASVGDIVGATYNFDGKGMDGGIVRYHLDMVGTITSGQWPPAEAQTLVITLTAWTKLYAGAKEKNACSVVGSYPFNSTTPVVFTVTRNDAAHTDDACDCPFDYSVDLVCP